jgi:hypothetical protein
MAQEESNMSIEELYYSRHSALAARFAVANQVGENLDSEPKSSSQHSSEFTRRYPYEKHTPFDGINDTSYAWFESSETSSTSPRNKHLPLGTLSSDDATIRSTSRPVSNRKSSIGDGTRRSISRNISWAAADRRRSSHTVHDSAEKFDAPSRPPSSIYTMTGTKSSDDWWAEIPRPQSIVTNAPILTPLNIAQTRDRFTRPEMCWYSGLVPMLYQPQIQPPMYTSYPLPDQIEDGSEKTESILDDQKIEYLKTLPLTFLVFGICLAVFLISLDRTIITTVSTT